MAAQEYSFTKDEEFVVKIEHLAEESGVHLINYLAENRGQNCEMCGLLKG